ncbi:hypothetical protein AB0I69_48320 [Streptomyces sp. NPDC050508]
MSADTSSIDLRLPGGTVVLVHLPAIDAYMPSTTAAGRRRDDEQPDNYT